MDTPTLRPGLPPLPDYMRDCDVDHRGFPVPWFVTWHDGDYDFRAVDPRKIREAYMQSKCWLCGRKLHRNRAFVIGPMCAVNRVSPEPPSHVECARFAAKACPFLSRPRMRRMPHEEHDRPTAGLMIERNPGACIMWVCRNYTAMRVDDDHPGLLFRIGDPVYLEVYAEGREATQEELRESFDSGLPILRAMAEEDEKREKGALDELERMTAKARRILKL